MYEGERDICRREAHTLLFSRRLSRFLAYDDVFEQSDLACAS